MHRLEWDVSLLVCPRGLRLIRLGCAPPFAECVQVTAAEPQFFGLVFRIGEAVLACGIERHALVAMEGPAGAQLPDEFLPLCRIGLLWRSGAERAVVAGLAKGGAWVRGVPDQCPVDRLPGRPAICANRDLAAVELDAVIGMDVHLGALASRA